MPAVPALAHLLAQHHAQLTKASAPAPHVAGAEDSVSPRSSGPTVAANDQWLAWAGHPFFAGTVTARTLRGSNELLGYGEGYQAARSRG